MFGRRRSAASSPAFNNGARASASAQTAAASAFLNNQASNASLSAAAAAVALRSRPMTPTSVADVQTKRTMRRTNSNSSMGSSVAGSLRGPPGTQLERRGSSGSMTERTFRDPSPNRGPARPNIDSAPPVPAIPKNITSTPPTTPHRRATSVDTPVTRVASPPPNLVSGRGSSLEPMRRNQPYGRSGARISNLSSGQELTILERPASRGSVNFSYPTGTRETSPYGQRRLTSPTPLSAKQGVISEQKQNLVYDPNSRRMVPESELLFIEQSIRNAAEKPVKKKKKIAPQGAIGTHFADGTVGGRIRGTAVNAGGISNAPLQTAEASQSSEPASTTAPPPRRRKKRIPSSDTASEDDSYMSPAYDYDSDPSDKAAKFNTRSGRPLAKKPSIVREDREGEEAEDETIKISERQAALGKLESGKATAQTISPPPVQQTSNETDHGRISISVPTSTKTHIMPISETALAPTASSSSTTTNETPSVEPNGEVPGKARITRIHSVSPARNAHFLASPESLSVRHQPPTRSISPMKSALKHSPSSRGSSPTEEVPSAMGTGHGRPSSEVSDTSTAMSDERNITKKKSVRVSFDDTNVVLGQSDDHTASDAMTYPNPQGRRGWFGSIGRGKKDISSIDDDDDEIMKPRPALPSFGSVREKKSRDVEERPLIKPREPSESAKAPSAPFPDASLGQSNDHAVGAVLAQDWASKSNADTSLSREPLPPEVTSVEGSGYVSDSGSSINSVDVPAAETENDRKEPPQNGHAKAHSTETTIDGNISVSDTTKSNDSMNIPALALTKASPTLEELRNNSTWPNIPGDFPVSSDSSEENAQPYIVEHRPTDLTPASLGITEPEPVSHPSGTPVVGDIAAENIHRRSSASEAETDDSDNSSIYSDAAEDLSDMQGDGFMSLDAVVESPVVPTFTALNIRTTPESPTTRNTKEKTNVKNGLAKESSDPKKDEDWDKIQKHWSGLTAEKRSELERAARDDSDEESDEEILEPPSKPKPIIKETESRVTQATRSTPDIKHNRTYQITPGAKAGPDGPVPIMRSSMRAKPADTHDSTRMRTSMRANGSTRISQGGFSQTATLPPEPKASLQKKYRPMSLPQPEVQPKSIEGKTHRRQISEGVGSVTKSGHTLRRKGSAESDSSFKRARPVTEEYTMRKSMRGPQQQQISGRLQWPDTTHSAMRPSRFTLRSLSPSGSGFRENQPRAFGQTMRTNRQFSNDSHVPTLRGPARQQSSRKFPGFGKSKSPAKAKAAPTRASRFADSSDEEDIRPSFRSRFVDSSDEEDDGPVTTSLTTSRPSASRAIPRRATDVDGDSSDLPDSDDEKSGPAPSAKTAKPLAPSVGIASPNNAGNALASGSLRRSGSGRGLIGAATTTSTTASGTGRPEQKRRSSLMSILRRKKPDPTSKVRKSDIESAARRDTPLERSRADLKAVRQDSNFSTVSGSASPKLQKRNVPRSRGTNEHWPLPAPQPEVNDEDVDEEKRPQTADDVNMPEVNGKGPPMNGRPDIGSRRSTAPVLAGVDLNTVIPPKKKKKFGMLRRAFRLDD